MLTVLSVAFPLAPVRPDGAGGAEHVLAALDRALVAAGARSLVVAAAGSIVAGELIALPPVPDRIDAVAQARARTAARAAIAALLARTPVDLVHCHGLDFADYLPAGGPPVLVTLHLPLDHYDPAALRPRRPRTLLHCVSDSQRRGAPRDLALGPTIPNGVALGSPPPAPGRRGWVAALGRICPEKGYDVALDAARAAGLPLLLAGRVFGYPAHRAWFDAEIRPRLDRRRRFLGPLGPRGRRRLLAGARCLVVPSRVAETSSLVAMEALAAGTPVVAAPVGALPEIVEPGRTGILAHGVAATAAAITAAGALDSAYCRAAAERRFGLGRMTEAYLSLYRDLIGAPWITASAS